ncbi:hypothetical protein BKA80DRAFT_42500 [Phyllosticta citrichinensis]
MLVLRAWCCQMAIPERLIPGLSQLTSWLPAPSTYFRLAICIPRLHYTSPKRSHLHILQSSGIHRETSQIAGALYLLNPNSNCFSPAPSQKVVLMTSSHEIAERNHWQTRPHQVQWKMECGNEQIPKRSVHHHHQTKKQTAKRENHGKERSKT